VTCLKPAPLLRKGKGKLLRKRKRGRYFGVVGTGMGLKL
jgi:hypothetical protein